MIPPWSLSAAFRLVLILLAASLSGAIASNPWTHDQEVIAGGQQRMKACVFGSPKTYDQWTIHYHEVKPSSQFPGQLILDPAWVARHQTVGDTDRFTLGTTWVPWAENRCQYSCNARKNCVSFAGYQAKDSTPNSGGFSCHFFDALIQPENIIPRPRDGPDQITHAYNRLCDKEAGI
ncbi:uncharacterized protein TrAFT101_009218 [Trichoderma asperellum]|uniref:Apple domain-containing protein n=1 Tax=Trichoderma asperellum (strain ATCC 204424 / CBS 433.97 / NBRC 101777) TaxID=1042311 RepID=A0A2T3YTU3_TRIA4|nr:hypothetical protein M441DRAFT_62309 [Trichoderma asperellum CBS 433.97]PTB35934.1 hypothetical protein M441DRAFT_62309 [Trichoderma asperellum CBS 433.97]UKZ94342.1 hypothetical protein TrAFT101_009218 [Trichoderma asperellum]